MIETSFLICTQGRMDGLDGQFDVILRRVGQNQTVHPQILSAFCGGRLLRDTDEIDTQSPI